MKRYFYLVLALLALMTAIGTACGGSGPSAPGADSTPATTDAPLTTPTAPADSTSATTDAPLATPTAPADSTPATTDAPLTTPTAPADSTSATTDAPPAIPTAPADSTPATTDAPLATPTAPADSTPATTDATLATPTAPADSTPAIAGTPLDTVYEGLLGAIPDTPEARASVFINDYALVRRIFASIILLPGPGDDEDAVAQFNTWLPPLFWPKEEADAPPVSWFGNHSFFGPVNHRNINFQYFAFDVRNMDQSIIAGPPRTALDVVRGRFDPQAADEALGTCSECPAPSREEHRGIPFYSWGEDYAGDADMKFAPPAFDSLGRGGRIAVLDEYVFRTLGASDMKALIDANRNEGRSLADVEEFRLLAGGMSRLGAYSMLLSDDVEVWGLEAESAEAGPRLRPYDAYAVGAGKDETGPYMALVLVHADDTSAEENVGLLRRTIEEGSSTWYDAPWSDFTDVDRLEIDAEGRVLMAKLRGGGLAKNPFQWWEVRDSLI